MVRTKFVEKTKDTHFVFNIVHQANRAVCDKLEKYAAARRSTDDDVIRRNIKENLVECFSASVPGI